MNTGYKLVVTQDGHQVQELKLSGEPVIIGREPDNRVVINHPQVSRKHVQISFNGQGWTLENLSQANPAVLNGYPVQGAVALLPDAPIQLGTAVVLVVTADVPAAVPGPAYNNSYVAQPVAPPNVPQNFVSQAQLPNGYAAPVAAPVVPQPPPQPQFSPDAAFGTMVIGPKPPLLKITYTDNNREISKDFVLIQPQINIGRAPENEIQIPIPTVSRNHASLKAGPQGYTMIDRGGANGLMFNGQRFQERNLLDGDVIRIGDNYGNFVSLTYEDSSRPAISQNFNIQLDPAVQNITIGRATDNYMRLDYPAVSAHHAVIRRQGYGATLEDLGSRNGTYVRGERVSGRPVELNPGDAIQIASYQLTYQPGMIAQATTNKVRIDALHLKKAVNNNSLVLLNDISITIQPKEFVALVGGSGAGKSTLMDALNGFRPASEGAVLFNGDDYYRNFAIYRTSLGYVPQDDIIHRELPVERALYYVAKLRLPEDTTDAEIEQRVVEVLTDVDMLQRRNVPVNKLSGGQRKRTSIAVELLAKPNLLFLDEPTSGLDPGLDKRLMYLMRRLADQGRTVILVTHATTNINVCDKVVFLGRGGKLCFFGTPQKALEFFDVREFPDIYTKLEETPTSADEWEARYRQSPYFQENIVQAQANIPAPAHPVQAPYAQAYGAPGYPPPPSQKPLRSPAVSAFNQFMILTRRYTELIVRDRVNLLFLILQAPIIGIILGLVAGRGVFEFGPGHPASLAQQVSFMLAMSGVWLGTINAAREITKENAIYMRERLVNLGVVPYIGSKVFVLAVLGLIQSFLLVMILAVLSGLPSNGAFLPSFIELIFSEWLTTLAGIGLGLLVSAFASNTDKAVSIIPIILIPQIILSGVIFNLSGPTKAFSYITITKWSLDSLGTTADLNRIFITSLDQQSQAVFLGTGCDYKDGIFNGNDYADNACIINDDNTLGSRAGHLLVRWFILILMTAVFLYGTYFVQKRKDVVALRS